MRVWAVLVIAATAAGCAASREADQAPIATQSKPLITLADAQRSIVERRSRLWKDPASIMDARIGEPKFCTQQAGLALNSPRLPASCVCVEANARNGYGGYTGMKRTIFVFFENGQDDTLDGGFLGFQEYCAETKPFPQLNGTPATVNRRRS